MKRMLAVFSALLGGKAVKGSTLTGPPSAPTSPKHHELRWTLLYAIALLLLAFAISQRWWGTALVGVILAATFLAFSTSGAIARATFDRGQDTFQADIERDGESEFSQLDESQIGVACVLIGLVAPEMLFPRIKERVSPLTKAFLVETAYTIQFPGSARHGDEDEGPITEYIPLVLAEKGVLHDDLRVIIAGDECPTASFDESVHIACIAARAAAINASVNLDQYAAYRGGLEVEIRKLVSNRRTQQQNGQAVDPYRERLTRRRRARKLRKRIRAHFPASPFRDLLEAIVDSLSTHYVIYAAVPRALVNQNSTQVLETRERHILAPRTRKMLKVPTSTWGALALKVGNALRAVYGMSPSDINYPLSKAFRASSYHLEIMGFEGSYLARQRYYPARGTDVRYRRFRSRRGQRYAHVYIRGLEATALPGVKGWDESPHVAVEFEERPPGSYAPAAFSSLAATLILIVAFRVSEHPPGNSTDIVALLLAAPGAILGWSGFLAEPRRFGSVATRVSSTLTLILSLVGFLQFTLGGSPRALIGGPLDFGGALHVGSDRLFSATWMLVATLSLINTVMVWTYWGQRALVHATFIDDEISAIVTSVRKWLSRQAKA